jgi:hypothetical protein
MNGIPDLHVLRQLVRRANPGDRADLVIIAYFFCNRAVYPRDDFEEVRRPLIFPADGCLGTLSVKFCCWLYIIL